MYNVDKLPESELRLHRTVASSDAARTQQMLADLENMTAYISESNLMSATFRQCFQEAKAGVQGVHNLFSVLERELTKRIDTPQPPSPNEPRSPMREDGDE